MDENKRGSFGSTIGFLLSAIGSAVGLDNIWGFPYKMGRGGGFTFLIVYLALAAFVGFAIMLSELAIGRSTGFVTQHNGNRHSKAPSRIISILKSFRCKNC